MSPVESVSRVEFPLQLRREAMRSPPFNTEIPPAKVEVAKEEVTAKVPIDAPPWKVLVAVVEVALKREAEMNPPETRLPETSKSPAIVEVAVVEVAKKDWVVRRPAMTEAPETPKATPGVVEPIPTKPFARTVKAVVVG
jgi:hypothetical protein